MLDEKKGTCCHRCGHVHVKGTKCPEGKGNCARRTNEMSVNEPSVAPFLSYLKQDEKALADFKKDFNFPSKATFEYIQDYIESLDHTDPDWKEFTDWQKEHQGEEPDEVNEYCTGCLIEYLLEYEHKLEEAEYRGRKVKLGKPFLTPGGPKKRSVYVKNAKGNVVKVNFGDPNLKIKKNIPARRKSFRARHKCHTAKDRTTPRYWSCKFW